MEPVQQWGLVTKQPCGRAFLSPSHTPPIATVDENFCQVGEINQAALFLFLCMAHTRLTCAVLVSVMSAVFWML